jgi:hypothetical protein
MLYRKLDGSFLTRIYTKYEYNIILQIAISNQKKLKNAYKKFEVGNKQQATSKKF